MNARGAVAVQRVLTRATVVGLAALSLACTRDEPINDGPAPSNAEASPVTPDTRPSILATNAFYYYEDVESAHAFYAVTLGLETVVDYGFAKIMRVAPASYLTLVDAARGMHSADEPKTVTLAFVTEQVEGWFDYLTAQGVTMRGPYEPREGQPHDGFVAIDPEGYYLEFERFNPHEENLLLMPVLDGIDAIGPVGATQRPEVLEVQATVLWLYYDDMVGIEAFWRRLLGVELIVDQGWAKVFPVSATGFVGPVDGTRGLHGVTEDKGVTVSFFTDDVAAWLERARGMDLELRTPDLTDESGRVSVFVGYDPEGYFLEWDTFLDVEGNERLLELIGR